MKTMKLVVITVIFSLLSSPFVWGLSVKPLNLKQLVSFSDTIFRGTLVSVKIDQDPYESGHLVKYYTFRVEDCLKGDCGEEITIKQLAGWPKGLPDYQEGKTYVLFIPEATEATGLVAPVGIWQGVYRLKKAGDRWVIPGLSKNSRFKAAVKGDDYDSFRAVIADIVKEGK